MPACRVVQAFYAILHACTSASRAEDDRARRDRLRQRGQLDPAERMTERELGLYDPGRGQASDVLDQGSARDRSQVVEVCDATPRHSLACSEDQLLWDRADLCRDLDGEDAAQVLVRAIP
jgi:hypothetical protein